MSDWDCLAPGRSGGLCTACRPGLADLLLGLEDDYAALGQILARGGGSPAEGGYGPNKPESAPPINLTVDALRTTIVTTAVTWEVVVRAHAQLSPRPQGKIREWVALTGAVRLLADHVGTLAAVPPVDIPGPDGTPVRRTGVAGLRRLARLHHLAERTLGLTDLYARIPGSCPACAAPALARDYGSDSVRCLWCDGRWTGDDYRRYVGLVVAWAGPSLTP